jgi:hypothetical protein
MEILEKDDPLAIAQTIEQAAQPEVDDFRTADTSQAFNWNNIAGAIANTTGLASERAYLVVFRSKRRENTNDKLIEKLDAAAHKEAQESAALYYYFGGTVDELSRRAVSWCLWTDQASARKGVSGPAHQEALRHASEFYEYENKPFVELYHVIMDASNVTLEPIEHPASKPQTISTSW